MSTASLQATAKRLIDKHGRPTQIVRKISATPTDPTKPWLALTPGTLSCTVQGVWYDPLKSRQDYQFSEKVEPGTLEQRDGWDVMVPALGMSFTPAVGDSVVDQRSGKTFRILTVSPTQPGLVGFFYTLQVGV